MENVNWIKIEPFLSGQQICCNLQFKDCVNVILTNSEVNYLIKELVKYGKSIEMVEKLVCSE